jgi:hypothetical protein
LKDPQSTTLLACLGIGVIKTTDKKKRKEVILEVRPYPPVQRVIKANYSPNFACQGRR